jgi:predicted RNA-binding protein YlxR (DUF448 family)
MRLLRVIRTVEGSLRVDFKRRLGGRGGYLHLSAECWDRFARRKGLVRSLGGTVDRTTRAALVSKLQLSIER